MLHDIGVHGIYLMCFMVCFTIESVLVECMILIGFHIWEVA